MKQIEIPAPNEQIRPLLEQKINNLTKPKGSLGRLEELALQIGLIQQTLTPQLHHPQNIIFAADHGIVAEGGERITQRDYLATNLQLPPRRGRSEFPLPSAWI